MGLEPRQLNDVDKRLLDFLHDDRSTPKLLRGRLSQERDEDDVPSAAYINQRLRRLEEHEHLRNLEGTGVYELVDDPREDVPDTDESDLRARLQDTLEARDDAQARADRLADDLEDCEELLDDCQERLARADTADLDVGRLRSGLQAAKSALDGQRPDVDTAEAEIDRALEVLQDAG